MMPPKNSDDSKKRVPFILCVCLGGGGAERQIYLLSQNMALRHIYMMENIVNYPVDESLIYRLRSKPGYPKSWVKLLLYPIYFFQLVTRFSSKDTVISFLGRANILNVLISFFTGHKAIVSERTAASSYEVSVLKKLQWHVTRFFYRRAYKVTCNAYGNKLALEKSLDLPASKVLAIPNALDFETIQSLAKGQVSHPFFEGNHHVFLTVGRFHPEKGHDYLIQAFYHVQQHFPDSRLIIIGDGDRAGYDQLAQSFKIDHAIDCVPFQDNPYAWIAAADTFVLSSLLEGFPNVLLEALATGTAAISTDCTFGPREVLNGSTDYSSPVTTPTWAKHGILSPPIDPSIPASNRSKEPTPLAQSMLNFLKDPERHKSYEATAQAAVTPYSIAAVTAQWQALCES